MRIIISGGGTGGHIYPAIAIADELKERKSNLEILFVGAKGRMEMEKVPKAGYPIKGLWISGLQRKLTTRNILFPIKLMHSLWKASSILKSYKPDVVVGVGGYASGPMLHRASANNIPTLIQEQNSYPGITNKLLAKKVDRICTAYEGMERFFPSQKMVLTGNPIRKAFSIGNINRQRALEHFGFSQDKKTILLVGGSLGARSLNEAIKNAYDLLKQRPDVNILWQIGQNNYENYKETTVATLDQVKAVPFIDRMDYAYAIADLTVCRAGALTVSELCLLGQPAILVPSPYVAEDHQTKNAQALVNKNAALMMSDKDCNDKLVRKMLEIVNDDPQLNSLSERIIQLAKPNATKDIVDEIEKLVNQNKK